MYWLTFRNLEVNAANQAPKHVLAQAVFNGNIHCKYHEYSIINWFFKHIFFCSLLYVILCILTYLLRATTHKCAKGVSLPSGPCFARPFRWAAGWNFNSVASTEHLLFPPIPNVCINCTTHPGYIIDLESSQQTMPSV